MRTIKCYFQSCKETIEVDVDEAPQANGSANVLTAGATFGHSQYHRVPFGQRDEQSLSGKPWTCPYHDAMTAANLALTIHEERQRQALIGQVRSGKMIKRADGWYEQTPQKPVPERITHEDDGSARANGTMMRWWSQEQMIDHLNGESQASKAAVYTPPADDGEDEGQPR
jgi:hypothetical protein